MTWARGASWRMVLWGLIAAPACGGAPAASEEKPVWELIDMGAWRLVDAGEDPFPDRPTDADCPPQGYGEEYGYFEVETGVCTYGTFTQPLLSDLARGERTYLLMWWLELWADPATTGHLAFRVGDQELASATPPIPGPPGVVELDITMDTAVDAGTPVYFHVHNHGANSWVIADFVRAEAEAEAR